MLFQMQPLSQFGPLIHLSSVLFLSRPLVFTEKTSVHDTLRASMETLVDHKFQVSVLVIYSQFLSTFGTPFIVI